MLAKFENVENNISIPTTHVKLELTPKSSIAIQFEIKKKNLAI